MLPPSARGQPVRLHLPDWHDKSLLNAACKLRAGDWIPVDSSAPSFTREKYPHADIKGSADMYLITI